MNGMNFDINLELDKAISSLNRFEREFEDTRQKLTKPIVVDVDGKGTDVIGNLSKNFDKARSEASKMERELKSAMASVIASGGKGTAEFKALENELEKVTAEAKRLDDAFEQVGKSSGNVGQKQGKFSGLKDSLGGLNLGGFALGGGVAGIAATGVELVQEAITKMIDLGKQYETGMAEFSAITGVSGDALTNFGQKARNLAKEFGGDVTTQIDAFKGVLSRLGPGIANSPEALDSMARSINTLAKAGGLDAAQSMDALTTAALQFKVDLSDPVKAAEEMAKMMNTMAAGAKFGAAEIPQIAEALVVSGAAAKGANVSFEEVNAAIQVLATGGKFGSEAGTGLRNFILKLQEGSAEGATELKKLGTNYKEVGTILTEQGLGAAISKLSEGFNKLGSDQEKNVAIIRLFGLENQSVAQNLLTNSDALKQFTTDLTGTNVAAEQAGVNMNTMAERMKRASANINDIFLGIYNAVVPPLVAAFDVIVSTIKSTVDLITPFFQEVFNGVVEGLEPLFNAFKKLWDALQNVFKLFGDGKNEADGLKTAFKFLGDIIGWLIETQIKVMTFLLTVITDGFANIVYTVGNVIRWFQNLGKQFQEFLNSGSFVANIIKVIYMQFEELIGGVVKAGRAVLEFLGIIDKAEKKAPLKKKVEVTTTVNGKPTNELKIPEPEIKLDTDTKIKQTGAVKEQKTELQKLTDEYNKLRLKLDDLQAAGKGNTTEFDNLLKKITEVQTKIDNFNYAKKLNDAIIELQTLSSFETKDLIKEIGLEFQPVTKDDIDLSGLGDGVTSGISAPVNFNVDKNLEKLNNELKPVKTELEKFFDSIQPDFNRVADGLADSFTTAFQEIGDAYGTLNEVFKRYDESRQKESGKLTKEESESQLRELSKRYAQDEINYSEYVREKREIEQNTQKANESSNNEFQDRLVAGLRKASESQLQIQQESISNYQKLVKEAGEDDAKTVAARKQMYADLTVSTLANLAAVLATGKATLGDVVSLVLDSAMNLLTAQIPVWVAGIFGTTVAELGPVGIGVAAAATAGLMALVAIAKSALSSAKGAEEGYNPFGTKTYGSKGRSDTQQIWVNPNEAILTEKMTKDNKAFIEHLFKGGDTDSFIQSKLMVNTAGKLEKMKPAESRLIREYIKDKQDNKNVVEELKSVKNELVTLRKEMKNTKLINNYQNLKVSLSDTRKPKVELQEVYK